MVTKDKNTVRHTGRPRRKRTASAARPSQSPEMQVQYTPAKPFNRNRFLLRLATVAAIVLALVFGMSIFFKTQQVNVSGAEKYTPWEIKEASGIQNGDALLSLSEAKITAKIRAKLPYVGDVRVGIKLPDTVNIEIKELEVVYAAEDANGLWWLLDANGRVVDSTNAASAKDHTRILGVQIQDVVVGEQAVAFQPEAQTGTEATGAAVPTQPAIPASQLLDAAVQILKALESNGVMGNVDTVDVTDTQNLVIWYQNRYHVTLGDTSRLEYKVGALKAAIQKMDDYQSGYLDVSFKIWSNEVGYRPFEDNSGGKN